MLNTNFFIALFIKTEYKLKFISNKYFNRINNSNYSFISNIKKSDFFLTKKTRVFYKNIYQYKLNIFLYIFLLLTLYKFFFLSLTNQNVLCLVYLTVGMTLYLLLSGYIYFIKLYAYNRFTGFIQDFWRLSLTVFWLIEGSLLLVILFALAFGPLLPHHIYKSEIKVGCEYVQYISFESFIVKHIPLLFLVVFTSKEDDEQTTSEHLLVVLLSSILITWVLLDEFYLLFHITNVYMRETPTYIWGSKKWNLSHSVLWRTKMWVSYFGICTFTKFLHIVLSAYFVLFWLASSLKEGGVSSENDNIEEASDENIKAAANFNLVALYVWTSYMVLYPLLNRTVFVFFYNDASISSISIILTRLVKETALLII